MTRPVVIGLTGSIGMGKSTTAAMFAEAGIAVWDADAAVHRLYAAGGPAAGPIAELCPDAVKNGAVDRAVLKEWIARDPAVLGKISDVVHPLVAADRAGFLEAAEGNMVVLDIPLLFETGAAEEVDAVVVVSAPADIQRQRVLDRGQMDKTTFETILAKQMPDAEKRARADFVIETVDMETARKQVRAVIDALREAENA